MTKPYILFSFILVSWSALVTAEHVPGPNPAQVMIGEINTTLGEYKKTKATLQQEKNNYQLNLKKNDATKKIIELQEDLYQSYLKILIAQRLLLSFQISQLADYYYCSKFSPKMYQPLTTLEKNSIFYKNIKPAIIFNTHFKVYELNQFLTLEGFYKWEPTVDEKKIIFSEKLKLKNSGIFKQIEIHEQVIQQRMENTGLIKEGNSALGKGRKFKSNAIYLQQILLNQALLFSRFKNKFKLSETLNSRCL